MKKVLFATTALVASAGIASAQGVTLSGSAEIGVVGGDGIETQLWNDIDVKFTLSGETDNGLTFGATIDLDELNGDNINATAGGTCRRGTVARVLSTTVLGSGVCPGAENDSSVFLSGAFGTITMGDTDGAFDWALQDLDIIGDIADANTTHSGFNGNSGLDGTYDGQVARYDYSFGDFSFAASVEQDDSVVVGPVVYAVGGKYKGDFGGFAVGLGLGYQSNGNVDLVGVSVDAKTAGGIRGVLNYTDYSGTAAGTGLKSHIGVGVFYTMDAISVGINYGQYERNNGQNKSGVGLAANYDLGGGAVAQFGYSTSDSYTGVNTDVFSLGVAMSF